jgi:hypothetical protein
VAGSAREQENLGARGEIGIANPFGSIVLLHGPRHPATPFPRRSSEQDLDTSRKLVNPLIELFSSPILFATGIHFPSVLLHNQNYPKIRLLLQTVTTRSPRSLRRIFRKTE